MLDTIEYTSSTRPLQPGATLKLANLSPDQLSQWFRDMCDALKPGNPGEVLLTGTALAPGQSPRDTGTTWAFRLKEIKVDDSPTVGRRNPLMYAYASGYRKEGLGARPALIFYCPEKIKPRLGEWYFYGWGKYYAFSKPDPILHWVYLE